MNNKKERICPDCGRPSENERTLLCAQCEAVRRRRDWEWQCGKSRREKAYAALVRYASRPDVQAAIKASIRAWVRGGER